MVMVEAFSSSLSLLLLFPWQMVWWCGMPSYCFCCVVMWWW
jgi:hypothetical protein